MNVTFSFQDISEIRRLPKLSELGCSDLLKIQEGLNRLIYPPRPTWSHQHCPHCPDLTFDLAAVNGPVLVIPLCKSQGAMMINVSQVSSSTELSTLSICPFNL